MSKKHTVLFRGIHFWAYDVVSNIYSKFLIDAANERVTSEPEKWLTNAIESWRGHIVASDLCLTLDDAWTRSQIDVVIALCEQATKVLRKQQSLSAAEVESWPIFADEGIRMRGHDPIPCEPIAKFGDAIVTLLNNTLPTPPKDHWWFFTLEPEIQTIEMGPGYEEVGS